MSEEEWIAECFVTSKISGERMNDLRTWPMKRFRFLKKISERWLNEVEPYLRSPLG